MSARSVSRWEETELYSPAAIDIAPATTAATPAITIALRLLFAATTPMRRLAVDTTPSCAPRTAARNQPMRPVRWISPWMRAGIPPACRIRPCPPGSGSGSFVSGCRFPVVRRGCAYRRSGVWGSDDRHRARRGVHRGGAGVQVDPPDRPGADRPGEQAVRPAQAARGQPDRLPR